MVSCVREPSSLVGHRPQRPHEAGPVCAPPPSTPSRPDHARPELLALLHGQWRVATRAVMLLLSLQGWSATAIAELLGCHPRTVRRWIGRFNHQGTAGLVDRPRSGGPRLGSRRLAKRIR